MQNKIVVVAFLCIVAPVVLSKTVGGISIDDKVYVSHVLLIGVDGLKPACIENATGGAPNIHKLMQQGSWTTTRARTTIETVSAPGWSAILCGMDSTSTGIHDNNWEAPWIKGNPKQAITPVTGNENPFHCVFTAVKNASLSTAAFYDWDWLMYLGNESIQPPAIDTEVYCSAEDWTSYSDCDKKLATAASELLSSSDPPNFTFLYLGSVDETGHTFNWCSQQYEDQVGVIDTLVGQVFESVRNNPLLANDTLILLTADHGGDPGTQHHGSQDDDCLIIPWIAWAPSSGVRVNYPIRHEVRNMDTSATALYALGISSTQPWYWKGEAVTEIFT